MSKKYPMLTVRVPIQVKRDFEALPLPKGETRSDLHRFILTKYIDHKKKSNTDSK